VVLSCNNFEVIDLGVMVPVETILDAARREQADLVAVSGLITPSLEEMARVAAEMEREGFTIPLILGGATTSKVHTALKIAPNYSQGVVYVPNASKAVEVARKLVNPKTRPQYLAEINSEYEIVRSRHQAAARTLVSIEEARAKSLQLDFSPDNIVVPNVRGISRLEDVPLQKLRPYIDWTYFFMAWEMQGIYPKILEDPRYGTEARRLFEDANRMLDTLEQEHILTANAVYGIFPANRSGDDILVFDPENPDRVVATFHTLRQQVSRKDETYRSLADYLAPLDSGFTDFIGGFIVTSGLGAQAYADQLRATGDDYSALLVKLLADRLAEAFAEWLHEKSAKKTGVTPMMKI